MIYKKTRQITHYKALYEIYFKMIDFGIKSFK